MRRRLHALPRPAFPRNVSLIPRRSLLSSLVGTPQRALDTSSIRRGRSPAARVTTPSPAVDTNSSHSSLCRGPSPRPLPADPPSSASQFDAASEVTFLRPWRLASRAAAATTSAAAAVAASGAAQGVPDVLVPPATWAAERGGNHKGRVHASVFASRPSASTAAAVARDSATVSGSVITQKVDASAGQSSSLSADTPPRASSAAIRSDDNKSTPLTQQPLRRVVLTAEALQRPRRALTLHGAIAAATSAAAAAAARAVSPAAAPARAFAGVAPAPPASPASNSPRRRNWNSSRGQRSESSQSTVGRVFSGLISRLYSSSNPRFASTPPSSPRNSQAPRSPRPSPSAGSPAGPFGGSPAAAVGDRSARAAPAQGRARLSGRRLRRQQRQAVLASAAAAAAAGPAAAGSEPLHDRPSTGTRTHARARARARARAPSRTHTRTGARVRSSRGPRLGPRSPLPPGADEGDIAAAAAKEARKRLGGRRYATTPAVLTREALARGVGALEASEDAGISGVSTRPLLGTLAAGDAAAESPRFADSSIDIRRGEFLRTGHIPHDPWAAPRQALQDRLTASVGAGAVSSGVTHAPSMRPKAGSLRQRTLRAARGLRRRRRRQYQGERALPPREGVRLGGRFAPLAAAEVDKAAFRAQRMALEQARRASIVQAAVEDLKRIALVATPPSAEPVTFVPNSVATEEAAAASRIGLSVGPEVHMRTDAIPPAPTTPLDAAALPAATDTAPTTATAADVRRAVQPLQPSQPLQAPPLSTGRSGRSGPGSVTSGKSELAFDDDALWRAAFGTPARRATTTTAGKTPTSAAANANAAAAAAAAARAAQESEEAREGGDWDTPWHHAQHMQPSVSAPSSSLSAPTLRARGQGRATGAAAADAAPPLAGRAGVSEEAVRVGAPSPAAQQRVVAAAMRRLEQQQQGHLEQQRGQQEKRQQQQQQRFATAGQAGPLRHRSPLPKQQPAQGKSATVTGLRDAGTGSMTMTTSHLQAVAQRQQQQRKEQRQEQQRLQHQWRLQQEGLRDPAVASPDLSRTSSQPSSGLASHVAPVATALPSSSLSPVLPSPQSAHPAHPQAARPAPRATAEAATGTARGTPPAKVSPSVRGSPSLRDSPLPAPHAPAPRRARARLDPFTTLPQQARPAAALPAMHADPLEAFSLDAVAAADTAAVVEAGLAALRARQADPVRRHARRVAEARHRAVRRAGGVAALEVMVPGAMQGGAVGQRHQQLQQQPQQQQQVEGQDLDELKLPRGLMSDTLAVTAASYSLPKRTRRLEARRRGRRNRRAGALARHRANTLRAWEQYQRVRAQEPALDVRARSRAPLRGGSAGGVGTRRTGVSGKVRKMQVAGVPRQRGKGGGLSPAAGTLVSRRLAGAGGRTGGATHEEITGSLWSVFSNAAALGQAGQHGVASQRTETAGSSIKTRPLKQRVETLFADKPMEEVKMHARSRTLPATSELASPTVAKTPAAARPAAAAVKSVPAAVSAGARAAQASLADLADVARLAAAFDDALHTAVAATPTVFPAGTTGKSAIGGGEGRTKRSVRAAHDPLRFQGHAAARTLSAQPPALAADEEEDTSSTSSSAEERTLFGPPAARTARTRVPTLQLQQQRQQQQQQRHLGQGTPSTASLSQPATTPRASKSSRMSVTSLMEQEAKDSSLQQVLQSSAGLRRSAAAAAAARTAAGPSSARALGTAATQSARKTNAVRPMGRQTARRSVPARAAVAPTATAARIDTAVGRGWPHDPSGAVGGVEFDTPPRPSAAAASTRAAAAKSTSKTKTAPAAADVAARARGSLGARRQRKMADLVRASARGLGRLRGVEAAAANKRASETAKKEKQGKVADTTLMAAPAPSYASVTADQSVPRPPDSVLAALAAPLLSSTALHTPPSASAARPSSAAVAGVGTRGGGPTAAALKALQAAAGRAGRARVVSGSERAGTQARVPQQAGVMAQSQAQARARARRATERLRKMSEAARSLGSFAGAAATTKRAGASTTRAGAGTKRVGTGTKRAGAGRGRTGTTAAAVGATRGRALTARRQQPSARTASKQALATQGTATQGSATQGPEQRAQRSPSSQRVQRSTPSQAARSGSRSGSGARRSTSTGARRAGRGGALPLSPPRALDEAEFSRFTDEDGYDGRAVGTTRAANGRRTGAGAGEERQEDGNLVDEDLYALFDEDDLGIPSTTAAERKESGAHAGGAQSSSGRGARVRAEAGARKTASASPATATTAAPRSRTATSKSPPRTSTLEGSTSPAPQRRRAAPSARTSVSRTAASTATRSRARKSSTTATASRPATADADAVFTAHGAELGSVWRQALQQRPLMVIAASPSSPAAAPDTHARTRRSGADAAAAAVHMRRNGHSSDASYQGYQGGSRRSSRGRAQQGEGEDEMAASAAAAADSYRDALAVEAARAARAAATLGFSQAKPRQTRRR